MPHRPRKSPSGLRNRFLARLPEIEYARLLPDLQSVPLAYGQILYEPRGPIDYAYFPTGAVLSALTMMEDGIFKSVHGVTTIEEVLRVITE